MTTERKPGRPSSKPRAPRPTAERIREVFDYDPKTGHLVWRCQLNPRGKLGERAGCFCNGRLYIQIDHYKTYASIVIWVWMTGEWPQSTVDHADCDPSNDCWLNLRLATYSQQSRNQHRRRDNTSGEKGVWKTRNGQWAAEAFVDKRKIRLGIFKDKEKAIAARRVAANTLYGEFVRHD